MNDQDQISQITLDRSLVQTQRILKRMQQQRKRMQNLFQENKNMPYKVFVTDVDNNIIWDLDDALHRMFANTLQEVDEFLTLLFVKYGPMYNYYIYYTRYERIYRAKIHFQKIGLNSSDNPILCSEISPFIP